MIMDTEAREPAAHIILKYNRRYTVGFSFLELRNWEFEITGAKSTCTMKQIKGKMIFLFGLSVAMMPKTTWLRTVMKEPEEMGLSWSKHRLKHGTRFRCSVHV